MYKLTLILILFISINGSSQHSDSIYSCKILTIDQFQGSDTYSEIINQLENENRINTTDATSIKLLSSNGFVAFEQTPDSLVKQHGKISKENIELTLTLVKDNIDFVIIITSHSGFYHAFKYDLSQNILHRIPNKGSVILLASDKIKFKHSENSIIVFYAENQYAKISEWIKYYHLDLRDNTFSYKKYCILNNAEEECEEIEHIHVDKYLNNDGKK